MKRKINEIRTPRENLLLGLVAEIDGERVVLSKQGKKVDVVTLDEIASELYGKPVRCLVLPHGSPE